jgi:hypothetical protein
MVERWQDNPWVTANAFDALRQYTLGKNTDKKGKATQGAMVRESLVGRLQTWHLSYHFCLITSVLSLLHLDPNHQTSGGTVQMTINVLRKSQEFLIASRDKELKARGEVAAANAKLESEEKVRTRIVRLCVLRILRLCVLRIAHFFSRFSPRMSSFLVFSI